MLYAILTYSNMCPAPYPSKMNPRLYFPLVAAARCKECFYKPRYNPTGILHYALSHDLFSCVFQRKRQICFGLPHHYFFPREYRYILSHVSKMQSLRINQNSITVLFELSMKLYSLTYSSTISCSSRISI